MKAVTVGVAASAILGTMLWQLHAMLTQEILFWLFMFFVSSLLALFLSWGVTNAWKYDRWTYEEWVSEIDVKRTIKRFARWACAGAQLVANVILVLLAWPDITTWPARIQVAAILTALMWLITLCYWSPDLWKWTRSVILPRLNRDISDGPRNVVDNGLCPPADYAPTDNDLQDPSTPIAPKPPQEF